MKSCDADKKNVSSYIFTVNTVQKSDFICQLAFSLQRDFQLDLNTLYSLLFIAVPQNLPLCSAQSVFYARNYGFLPYRTLRGMVMLNGNRRPLFPSDKKTINQKRKNEYSGTPWMYLYFMIKKTGLNPRIDTHSISIFQN